MNKNISNNIAPIHIQDEMRSCYLDYAMSVIIGRALPDVRDGLKPVHRRALYAMHRIGNYHNKPFVKSARVVGDVIGKYHPHGDSAVYQTVVRLAQDFSMRYPLVDGQGNFGSIDGDSAAAMRYTEIRMKKISEEMLKDLDKETVDWQPNYDDSLTEPTVFPTKIPNLLINGSSGIAVGMATNSPPHNLTEVMSALKLLINKPDVSIAELVEKIIGPDFPTGGIIFGSRGIKSAYHTGRGVIQIRSRTEIEKISKDRERIIVTEIPYQVNKSKLIEKVAELVTSKQLTGISDIRDESNRQGIRIVFDLKRGEIGNIILNRLFKQTQLQTSFGIIFLSILNKMPRVMNLKEQLNAFIDHRKEVVIRRTIFELKKAKEKIHILEGLKIAVENIDAVIEDIKKSESPLVAKSGLTKKYSLSERQAQAILDMKLQRLTGLERNKIILDYNNLLKEIEYLEGVLNSDQLISKIIEEEFDDIFKNYGEKRKTEIIVQVNEILDQDLIKNEKVIITITRKGYVKRMEIDTYKTQKRGGKGVKGSLTENDIFTDIFTANTHSTLYFFTNKGNVFNKKVYEIPAGSRTANGRNIVNLVPMSSGEETKSVLCIDDLERKDQFIVFATQRGLVKKSLLQEYKKINTSGKKAIKMVDGDSLLDVKLVSENKDILLCATSGKMIRFAQSDCRPLGRVSQGVKGIDISKNERIIGLEIVDDKSEIFSITEHGFGKRTKLGEYRKQSRGGKGVISMKLTAKKGKICAIKSVSNDNDLMIITNKGQVIRTEVKDISLVGRATQGVRIIRLNDNENVVAVEKLCK